MSRLRRACVLVTLGALALPIVSGGPNGHGSSTEGSALVRLGANRPRFLPSPSLAPVISLDGQRLAQRVRVSRDYVRVAPKKDAPKLGGTRTPSTYKSAPSAVQPRTARPAAVLRRAPTPQRGGLNWAALEECESSGNPRAVNPSGKYRGLHQFDMQTWRSVGGVGDPIDASPAEQRKRAWMLYLERGRAPWPECGSRL